MSFYTYLAIGLYFVILIYIGKRNFSKEASVDEYLLDNRRLGPFMTALSAGASDMSGWMLLGLPGALYLSGISEAWIAIGLSIGAWANYKFLAKRLRIYTEVSKNSSTIPDFLENRFRDRTKILRLVSATIIVFFFTLYVSSGIIAGGKTFESFFGLHFAYGAIFTLLVVVFYTFFGGFKAVCETDVFQGLLMLCILILIPLVAYFSLEIPAGGSIFSEIKRYSDELETHHLSLFEEQTFFGILGLLAWGLGYFGQPHIIIRFMAIRDASELKEARRIGISWMVLGLLCACLSGLIGFVYFNQQSTPLSDPETVFLKLGDTLFHPFIIGVIISAILAAIMSTISSQLLVSSSSATKDFLFEFFKKDLSERKKTLLSRIFVIVIAIVSTLVAFILDDTVLKVVGYAWAGFGASFGPVLLFSLYSSKTTALSAIVGMITGGLTVIVWIVSGLNSYIYELLPGFLLSSLAIWLVNLVNSMHNKQDLARSRRVLREFEYMKERV